MESVQQNITTDNTAITESKDNNVQQNIQNKDLKDNSIQNLILDIPSLEKELICSICGNIIYKPYCCNKCEKCFCHICIQELYKKGEKCPNCLSNLRIEKSELMEKFLSLFKYKCINNCDSILSYDQISSHLSECPAKDIKSAYSALLEKIKKTEEEFKVIETKFDEELKKSISDNIFHDSYCNVNTFEELKPNLFVSIYHPHALVHLPSRGSTCSCDICRRSVCLDPGDYSYACSFCDFDMCPRCIKKEIEQEQNLNNN